MLNFKSIFGLIFLISMSFGMQAQHIKDGSGKKYYDEEQTKLKEVYSYKEKNIFNPRDPSAGMKKVVIKHGPYFFYYESGQLKISGNYKDDDKHGEWKYYSESGEITKKEYYKNGKLDRTIDEPKPEGSED